MKKMYAPRAMYKIEIHLIISFSTIFAPPPINVCTFIVYLTHGYNWSCGHVQN